MSDLAKSSHVVLREASEFLASCGGPRYVVDRMAILAELSRQNREDGHRLVRAVYNGLSAEADILGDGESLGGNI